MQADNILTHPKEINNNYRSLSAKHTYVLWRMRHKFRQRGNIAPLHGGKSPRINMFMSKKEQKRVMVVMGTRPEAIKLAPIVKALQEDPRFTACTVNTGQHREMLASILEWFSIKPDHTLDVMEPGQPLAALSGKLLNGLHAIMEQERPDIVLVQGDTTTAFIAALAAYYGYDYYIRNEEGARRFIQIAHVEAGLRTHNNYAPFPEEVNRRLVSHLANWHFAPTITAAQALKAEGITKQVFITGNTVVDALNLTVKRLEDMPHLLPEGVTREDLKPPYILITGHRRENYGKGLDHICEAILILAKRYPGYNFIYPVHLNQHVQGPVHAKLGNQPNIILTPPASYPAFINLMRHCHLVLTDSGGLQEEAPSLGKPVMVMRTVTERDEGIKAGSAKLVGTHTENIVGNVAALLDDPVSYKAMCSSKNPYGDGHATMRILNLLAGEDPSANIFHTESR